MFMKKFLMGLFTFASIVGGPTDLQSAGEFFRGLYEHYVRLLGPTKPAEPTRPAQTEGAAVGCRVVCSVSVEKGVPGTTGQTYVFKRPAETKETHDVTTEETCAAHQAKRARLHVFTDAELNEKKLSLEALIHIVHYISMNTDPKQRDAQTGELKEYDGFELPHPRKKMVVGHKDFWRRAVTIVDRVFASKNAEQKTGLLYYYAFAAVYFLNWLIGLDIEESQREDVYARMASFEGAFNYETQAIDDEALLTPENFELLVSLCRNGIRKMMAFYWSCGYRPSKIHYSFVPKIDEVHALLRSFRPGINVELGGDWSLYNESCDGMITQVEHIIRRLSAHP